MPQPIGVYDGGTTSITIHGKPVNVGVVIFRVSKNESAPVDHIAYCKLYYKDSIIKNLKRLVWANQNIEEMVKVERGAKETDGVEQKSS